MESKTKEIYGILIAVDLLDEDDNVKTVKINTETTHDEVFTLTDEGVIFNQNKIKTSLFDSYMDDLKVVEHKIKDLTAHMNEERGDLFLKLEKEKTLEFGTAQKKMKKYMDNNFKKSKEEMDSLKKIQSGEYKIDLEFKNSVYTEHFFLPFNKIVIFGSVAFLFSDFSELEEYVAIESEELTGSELVEVMNENKEISLGGLGRNAMKLQDFEIDKNICLYPEVLKNIFEEHMEPLDEDSPVELIEAFVSSKDEYNSENFIEPLIRNSSGGPDKDAEFLAGGMAISSDSSIIVSFPEENLIKCFTLDGTYIRSIGEGTLFNPSGLCIDTKSDILYVCDSGNHRICVYTVGGVFLRQINLLKLHKGFEDNDGRGREQIFYKPVCIAFGVNSNNIYISFYDHDVIQIYNKQTGDQLESFLVHGFENDDKKDDFDDLVKLFQQRDYGEEKKEKSKDDMKDDFYRKDVEYDRSRKCMAVTEDGHVFICDDRLRRISKYSSDGTLIGSFGGLGSGNGEFNGSLCISISNDGYLVVSDTFNLKIDVYDQEGRLHRTIPMDSKNWRIVGNAVEVAVGPGNVIANLIRSTISIII